MKRRKFLGVSIGAAVAVPASVLASKLHTVSDIPVTAPPPIIDDVILSVDDGSFKIPYEGTRWTDSELDRISSRKNLPLVINKIYPRKV